MDGSAAGLVGPRTAQRRFPCSFFCYLVYFAVAIFLLGVSLLANICREMALALQDGLFFMREKRRE